MASKSEEGLKVRYLTDEEAAAMFEENVQRELGISTEEFLRAYDAGEFGDVDKPGLIDVVMLLPLIGRE